MKNSLIKLTLFAGLLLCSSAAYGQKFGYINSQELISLMPELDSIEIKLQKLSNDYSEQLELIQVEYNNKLNDYQKAMNTLSDGIRQMKEKELLELQKRFQESQNMAQQDMQKTEQDLMAPVIARARDAIQKVSMQNAFLIVFDQAVNPIVYFDEAQLVNVLPLVKTELGIKDEPKADAAATK